MRVPLACKYFNETVLLFGGKSFFKGGENTMIMAASFSPVIRDMSVSCQHSEHRLSVPVLVSDLKLDGHAAARSRCWHYK